MSLVQGYGMCGSATIEGSRKSAATHSGLDYFISYSLHMKRHAAQQNLRVLNAASGMGLA